MPQVFGVSELPLFAVASLWVEADFLDDVNAHEKAISDSGFTSEGLPPNLNTTGFHPRGQVWGQHLASTPTHHTWGILRVANPAANPNSTDFSVGGEVPRYSFEIHHFPRASGKAGTVTPVWQGNDATQFLSGRLRNRDDVGKTWPDIEKALRRGPRKR